MSLKIKMEKIMDMENEVEIVECIESKKRNRNDISLEKKLNMLQMFDRTKQTKTQVAKKFGVPLTTLSTIIKNREKIENSVQTTPTTTNRKRIRSGKHEELETKLINWLNIQQQEEKVGITGPMIRSRAEILAAELGIANFKCSNGWLQRLQMRHVIVLDSAKKRTKTSPIAAPRKQKCEKYEYIDVFYENVDEDNAAVEELNEDEEEDEDLSRSQIYTTKNDSPRIVYKIELDTKTINATAIEEERETITSSPLYEYVIQQDVTDPLIQELSSISPEKEIVKCRSKNLPSKSEVLQAIETIDCVFSSIRGEGEIRESWSKVKRRLNDVYPQYIQLKMDQFLKK